MANNILKKARGKLRNYTFIDYFLSCIERYNELDFRDYCRHRSFSTVSIEGFLEEIPGHIVYYIKSGNTFSGFGAELRRTIDALYFADHYRLIPFVEYTEDYVYSEKESINGSCNPFEYYFEQISDLTATTVNMCPHIMFLEEHRRLIQNKVDFVNAYELSEEYIELAGKIVNKYLRINKTTKDYIESTLTEIIEEGTVGIHYRGTDFNIGYKRHPNVVTIDDYFVAMDKILEEHPEVSFFVATDDQRAIDLFINRYGHRVKYLTDVFRSHDGMPIHFSNDSRENHHYKLGLEILRDIIALSRCDYLVAGLSQVSFCSRIFKSSRNEEYAKMEIITRGIKQ